MSLEAQPVSTTRRSGGASGWQDRALPEGLTKPLRRRLDMFTRTSTERGPHQVPADGQSNFNGTVEWRPRYAFRPRSFDDLAEVVRYVRARLPKGTPIKAGGSRHSTSAAATKGAYIHPEGMAFVRQVDGGRFRVGSGTRLGELNNALWNAGYSLPVMGGYDGQTVAGALATGTHGSVLKYGPMNSLVRSIDMVLADGTKVRVEPRNGMTVPSELKRESPDIQLVQDNELFEASLTHLGTMGAVYSLVLETVPRFHLMERRTSTSVDEIKNVLAGGNIYHLTESDGAPEWAGQDNGRRFAGQLDDPYHVEFAFNPYTGKANATFRQKVHLEREPFDMSEPADADLVKATHLDGRYTRPVVGTWLINHFPKVVGFLADATGKIAPSQTTRINDQSVDAILDEAYLQRSYNVFNLGDGPASIPVRFGTFFVPLEGDKYLRAMDVLQRAAREWAEQHGEYQAGLISLRFVKGSRAHLGSAKDVASFEIIFGGHQEHADAMLAHYRRALLAELGRDVTYHFGQSTAGLTAQEVRDAYPRLDAWRSIRAQRDPDGVFLNDEQRRLGLE